MTDYQKARAAMLRIEAQGHRVARRRLLALARQAQAAHDPLGALKLRCAAAERLRLAKQADRDRLGLL